MDIDKYIIGKALGVSKVELQGETTLLVTCPGGFDPDTGAALPAKEQGFQAADLAAMREAAVQGVASAEEALAKAQARVAAFDEMTADALAVVQAAAAAQAVTP